MEKLNKLKEKYENAKLFVGSDSEQTMTSFGSHTVACAIARDNYIKALEESVVALRKMAGVYEW